jgi:DNA mismatch repair protein MutS2
VVATVGDEQDLLAETSTFSGRLLRLDEAWKGAGPGSLILLDELGSGTDPEEGAALAGALLAGLLERRALVVITTHLTPLAAEALEADGAYCAAMELDAATGRPTYRLLPGPPGGSEALALARRLGLDPSLIAAAEARLGPEGLDYRRLLGEVEALRQRLAAELERQTSARRDAEMERDRLSAELRALEAARREAGKSLRQEHERFRREVRGRLAVEVDRLREELDEGRRKGLAARATDRLMAAAPELPPDEPEPEGELEPGAEVRHRSLGWTGMLKELDRGRAVVDVAGKTLRCRANELIPRGTPERSSAKRPAVQVEEASSGGVAAELDLLGERVAAALDRLDDYLDRALLEGRTEVRIVHGHGTGRLREAVRAHLRRHPAVASWRPGESGEGGNGATVVTLA